MLRVLNVALNGIQRVLNRIVWLLGTRAGLAYVFLILFVSCSTVGAFLIYPPAGWITLGVTSGIYGYLLGSE